MKIEIETIKTRRSHYWRVIWYTRPLGWWRYKLIGSIGYTLHHKRILGETFQSYCLRLYYKSLNRMIITYKINWYGIPDFTESILLWPR